MEVLPQFRKSGGDIIALYKSINAPKTFPKEAELCSIGAENKWLSVTFFSEHFRHGLEALSFSPWHGLGELLIQCIVPTIGGNFPCCGPRKPVSGSQTKYPGTQQVQRAEGTWASNVPGKPSNMLQDGSCESSSFSQGSDHNTCLPPNSFLEENKLSFTNSFQQKFL